MSTIWMKAVAVEWLVVVWMEQIVVNKMFYYYAISIMLLHILPIFPTSTILETFSTPVFFFFLCSCFTNCGFQFFAFSFLILIYFRTTYKYWIQFTKTSYLNITMTKLCITTSNHLVNCRLNDLIKKPLCL